MAKIVNGINVSDFIEGFYGEHEEGNKLLSSLNLPKHKIPFKIDDYLSEREAIFKDGYGNDVRVSFISNDLFYDFTSEYLGKRRNFRIFKEWDGEDIDTIMHLESLAIGDCTCKIINGNLLE